MQRDATGTLVRAFGRRPVCSMYTREWAPSKQFQQTVYKRRHGPFRFIPREGGQPEDSGAPRGCGLDTERGWMGKHCAQDVRGCGGVERSRQQRRRRRRKEGRCARCQCCGSELFGVALARVTDVLESRARHFQEEHSAVATIRTFRQPAPKSSWNEFVRRDFWWAVGRWGRREAGWQWSEDWKWGWDAGRGRRGGDDE
jgi:hypothetical protein